MSMDMDKLMQQVGQMQEQMQKAQAELDEPAGEDRIIELLKTDLDAREREAE